MRIFARPGEHGQDLFWRKTGQNRQPRPCAQPPAPLPFDIHAITVDTPSVLPYTHPDSSPQPLSGPSLMHRVPRKEASHGTLPVSGCLYQ
jgi:hypothetical protein